MTIVTAYALFMVFASGPVTLGALPDKAECDRIGTLLQTGNPKTSYACLPYKMVVQDSTNFLTTK